MDKKNSVTGKMCGIFTTNVFKDIILSFMLTFLLIHTQGQSYTYYELSSKNQKQIAGARKDIEKSYEQENTLNTHQESSELTTKLISVYRGRVGAYRTIYETYSAHIYEFWTKFKGDPDEVSVAVDYTTQARDVYIAAQNELIEADRVREAVGKLRLLQDATIKFKQATELIEKAYEIYRVTPLESDPQTKMKNRQRNDSLQRVKEKQEGAVISPATNEIAQQPDTMVANHTANQVETKTTDDTMADQTRLSSEYYQTPPFLTNAQQATTAPHQPDTYATPVASTASYWVQIAACRVPLNKQQLANLVSDTLRVVEKLVDFWYKYRVGPFDYQQAENFRVKCGVKGAFIIRDR